MKGFIRALCVLFILYVTSYIVLRSLWTHRVQDNKKIEMQFPKDQGWLHAVFSPLCHLDAALSGMTFHIGPHPGEIEPENVIRRDINQINAGSPTDSKSTPAATTPAAPSPAPATTPAPTSR